jgi:hypothetical protein
MSSVILPIPGIFLILSPLINSIIFVGFDSKKNYPFGLFISEQILASILLQAIPALQVNRVASFILPLISYASYYFCSSVSIPFSIQ